MNKIKDWLDDIVLFVEVAIGCLLFTLWLIIFIWMPGIILGVLCDLELLETSKWIKLFTKYVKWWTKLLISPEEAEMAEFDRLFEDLKKHN